MGAIYMYIIDCVFVC